jgi:hypothetical protein
MNIKKTIVGFIFGITLCISISCGDKKVVSDDFDFNSQYGNVDQLFTSSSSFVIEPESSSSSYELPASSEAISSSALSSILESSSSELSSSSIAISSGWIIESSSSSSVVYNYSHYFDPATCIGLLCDIIDLGEFTTLYGVPTAGILPDINGTFTNPTIIPGSENPDPGNLDLLGQIDNFSWNGTGFATSGGDYRNFIQGSYQWNIVANWDPSQTTYGGNVQIRDVSESFAGKAHVEILSGNNLMTGTFYLAVQGNVVIFVESRGRYAIEWRP